MPVKFIADIGSNHNRDISRVEKLIMAAKEVGCYAVKFQLFRGDKLYAPEFPERIKEAQAQELPLEFIPKIFAICHAHKIEFHCTPFDLEAVEILKPYVNQFKIGSYEILNLKLIKACAETGKPLGIAFGNLFDEEGEIEDILDAVDSYNTSLTIYHCVSNYPAKPENCNMSKVINYADDNYWPLHKVSEVKLGWSDHTAQPGVIYSAVANAVDYIEFHLDLEDGQGSEYKHGHCWKPLQIKRAIEDVRIMEIANLYNDKVVVGDIHKWRADPDDGMRPMKQYRKELLEG